MNKNNIDYDYQQDALESLIHEINLCKHGVMCQMPTGTGKTHLAADLIRWAQDTDCKVLFLVNSVTLIDQTYKKFTDLGMFNIGIEQASNTAHLLNPVVLATPQSFSSDQRLSRYPSEHFSLIVIDEAHHSPTKTFRKIINHFAGAYKVGLTATANRTDKVGYANIFDRRIIPLTTVQAMQKGILTKCTINRPDINLDARDLRIRNNQFVKEDMDKMIGKSISKIVMAAKQEAVGKTIVYTPTIVSAELIKDALRTHNETAVCYHSKMTASDRADALRSFQKGESRFIVNPRSLVEGFDEPSTETILIAFPVLSVPYMTQMVGRGLRSFPGKERCHIISFAYIEGNKKRGIVHPEDTFMDCMDGELVDAIKAKAASALKKNSVDVLKIIAEAESYIKNKIEYHKELNRGKKIDVIKSDMTDFIKLRKHPRYIGYILIQLGLQESGNIPEHWAKSIAMQEATEKQKRVLKNNYIEFDPLTIRKGDACCVISHIMAERERRKQEAYA